MCSVLGGRRSASPVFGLVPRFATLNRLSAIVCTLLILPLKNRVEVKLTQSEATDITLSAQTQPISPTWR